MWKNFFRGNFFPFRTLYRYVLCDTHVCVAAGVPLPPTSPSPREMSVCLYTTGGTGGEVDQGHWSASGSPLCDWMEVHVGKERWGGLYSSRHLPCIIKVGAKTSSKIPCRTLYRYTYSVFTSNQKFFCFRLLAMSEMSFIDLLREKQKERAYKILGNLSLKH